jgi:hypothetical protein
MAHHQYNTAPILRAVMALAALDTQFIQEQQMPVEGAGTCLTRCSGCSAKHGKHGLTESAIIQLAPKDMSQLS